MGGPNHDDYAVTPGWTNDGLTLTKLQVYELDPGVALGNTLFPTLDSGVIAVKSFGWLTFSFDDGAGLALPGYVIVQAPGVGGSPPTLATPDPTEHIASGATEEAQCIFINAGEKWTRRFRLDQEYDAIQFGGDPGFLRVELTTEPL